MTKKEVRDSLRRFRIFYNVVIFGTLLILFKFDNLLRKSLKEKDFSYFLSYFFIMFASIYFFHTSGTNPGHPESNSQGNQNLNPKEIELKPPTLANDNSPLSLDLGEDIPQQRRSFLSEDNLNFSPIHGNFQASDDLEMETKEQKPVRSRIPERRYCEVCKIRQPFRTKHCNSCERCISKFDHHCTWIGSCVGELNHRKFWLFLFFETILQLWTYAIVSSGLDAVYAKTADPGEEDENPIDYLEKDNYKRKEYILFMLIGFIIFISTIFTGALLIFHTALILTNQTTWEFTRKDTLNYLSIYPRDFYPFSKGPWENIKMVFFHGNKIRNWQLPPIPLRSSPTKKKRRQSL